MFLSWKPETTSWRILATGDKQGVPLQQLNLPISTDTFRQRLSLHTFLLINIRLRDNTFFIPEKHSKPSIFQRTPQMEAVCGVHPVYLLTPPLHAFHTWLPYTMSPSFPSTSMAVLSQASVRVFSLHAGGSPTPHINLSVWQDVPSRGRFIPCVYCLLSPQPVGKWAGQNKKFSLVCPCGISIAKRGTL